MELPIKAENNYNLHYMLSMYEIEPALPQGETFQFGSSVQYNELKPLVDNKFSPMATSIGIIGGADGPTSVFISSKGKEKSIHRGLHGLPLHNCLSIPSFEKEQNFLFHLEGINTKHYEGKKYTLQ